MINENINKAKVLTAQGDRDIQIAQSSLEEGNEGKTRTASRRAAGFYISALNLLDDSYDYGDNFIANLRNLFYNNEAPSEVREAAMNLLERLSNKELSGKAAVDYAKIIIDFCGNKIKILLSAKE